jgi:tetratricopeptide (TPR) repeat protein/predicted Ser/Thr protein kinase
VDTQDADATTRLDGADEARPTASDHSQSDPPKPAGELKRGDSIGRYIVLEELGRGGMGIVFRAYDPELDRKVALKVLRGVSPYGPGADARSTLVREAQALAKLSHPNVISIHDVGTHDEEVFMAMELVRGTSLDRWIDQETRSWREVRDVFLSAGRGLAAAHEVGLIHRDFKPANVLVGDDGRVRVVDFGLARQQPELLEEAHRQAGPTAAYKALPLNTPETQDGVVIGTPSYMALEQHHGHPADEKSDQYAFCLSLYEGLYGRRPFVGQDVRELVEAKRGRLPDPPASSKVPGWVFKVIARGLDKRPENRFSSMNALLDALAKDPGHKLKRRATVAAIAAAVAGAALMVDNTVARGPALCEGAEASLEGTWGSAEAQALAKAFENTGVAYHANAHAAVVRALDDYAAKWVAMHRDACEATHVYGKQSDVMLDLRMACLDQRREELSALVTVLGEPAPETVERAASAAHALSSLAPCADEGTLAARIEAPKDEAMVAQISTLRSELARAKVLHQTGRTGQALELAETLTEQARGTGYRPIEAEAALMLGRLLEAEGNVVAARESLLAAAVAAKAGRHERVEAQAWTHLVGTVGHKNAGFEQAREWAAVAQAAIDAMGGDADLQARLLLNLGTVEFSDGDIPKARELLGRALELTQESFGPVHPRVADVFEKLGFAAIMSSDYTQAHEYALEALRVRKEALGSEHPDVAAAHRQVGFALSKLERYDETVAEYETALAIRKAALGPDHPEVAKTYGDLGTVHAQLGHAEEAEKLHHRAIQILTAAQADEPTAALGTAYHRLGGTLEVAGDLEGARKALLKAAEIRRQLYGDLHPFVISIEQTLGDLGRRQEDWEEAVTHYQAIIDAFDAAGEALGPERAGVMTKLGRARFELGQYTDAVTVLERAEDLTDGDPEIEYWMARALWQLGKERGRALALARAARSALPDEDDALAAEIDTWLDGR